MYESGYFFSSDVDCSQVGYKRGRDFASNMLYISDFSLVQFYLLKYHSHVKECISLIDGGSLKPLLTALSACDTQLCLVFDGVPLDWATLVDVILSLKCKTLTSCLSRAKWQIWSKSHRSLKVTFLT